MQKYIFLILISLFGLVSCTDESKREQKFFDTYREILIARESIQDSVAANKKVQEIIQKHGYDDFTFKQEFFDIAKDNDKFLKLIDSLRNSIIRDTSAFK